MRGARNLVVVVSEVPLLAVLRGVPGAAAVGILGRATRRSMEASSGSPDVGVLVWTV